MFGTWQDGNPAASLNGRHVWAKKLLRTNIPWHRVPAKSKGLVRIKIVFLFTVSKINPYKMKDMDGVLNWSWGFITCSQLLAYGGHDGSTNPWQVDLQVVELEQFWSVEITFESLNPSLESEMCSRRNHDSIVEMVDQHPVLAPLCYVETLVFYQKVMTKQ